MAINVTDVVETPSTTVQDYDANDDEEIDIDELFVAIDHYFEGQIDIDELFEVIDAYFG